MLEISTDSKTRTRQSPQSTSIIESEFLKVPAYVKYPFLLQYIFNGEFPL